MSCYVCGKTQEELGLECLLRCGRCKSDVYRLCGVKCQREDWIRHKRQCNPAVAASKKKKAPDSPATSTPGPSSNDDPLEVSKFFNGLGIMRGKKECKKYVDEDEEFVPLTEADYAQIAYPHPYIKFAGAAGIFGGQMTPQIFHAPDGKAFTVRQLAEAFAKSGEHDQDAHYCFFEGLVRHKEPHTFIALFGS